MFFLSDANNALNVLLRGNTVRRALYGMEYARKAVTRTHTSYMNNRFDKCGIDILTPPASVGTFRLGGNSRLDGTLLEIVGR